MSAETECTSPGSESITSTNEPMTVHITWIRVYHLNQWTNDDAHHLDQSLSPQPMNQWRCTSPGSESIT